MKHFSIIFILWEVSIMMEDYEIKVDGEPATFSGGAIL